MSARVQIGPETAAVGIGLLILGFFAWRAAKAAPQAIADAAQAVNPLNHDNAFSTGVNAVGGALVTDPTGPGKNADGSWTLGGWFYDTFNPATAQAVNNVTQPVFTGGASGSW